MTSPLEHQRAVWTERYGPEEAAALVSRAQVLAEEWGELDIGEAIHQVDRERQIQAGSGTD